MQLNFNGNNQTKVQYIVLSDSISSKSEYDQIINKEANLPTKVIEYNPNFWSGYNIIEPTQIFKEFKIEN
jgi:TATA-box binding protein (TBP) (component of TFIID and TFIIIB)